MVLSVIFVDVSLADWLHDANTALHAIAKAKDVFLIDVCIIFLVDYWLDAGFANGWPVLTGVPKSGVPSGFQVKRCILGDRLFPQPSPGFELA
jgi:hypothetical protein